MPEGVGYGAQSTASVGKTLNYIGNHAYANSGPVIITNGADATLLEFTMGNSYILANFAFGLAGGNVSNAKLFSYKISINGELVLENVSMTDSDGTLIFDGAALPQTLLFPSFATIKIEGSTTDADPITCFGVIAGKLYGKID
jgi:hypothetical protein